MTSLADLVSQMLEGGVAHPIVIETIRFWEAGMSEDSADKSADATERRREKDRKRKQLARSQNGTPSADKNADKPGLSVKGEGGSHPSSSQVIEVKEGSKTPLPPKPSMDNSDSNWAIDEWNIMAKSHGLAPVQSRSAERLRTTKSRLKECGGKDGWAHALVLVTQSPGLLGENDRGWKMDFDAFTAKKKFTKLMEGGYANWKPNNRNSSAFAQASRLIDESLDERDFDLGHDSDGGSENKPPPY